jgi:hypothetical protein
MTKKQWPDRLVGFMRGVHHWSLLTGALFTAVEGYRIVAILKSPGTDEQIDGHVIVLMFTWAFLGLLWLATREFFSAAERRRQSLPPIIDEWPTEEVFLVAFRMGDFTHQLGRDDLETELMAMLPLPQKTQGGRVSLEGWWVAEDDRHDDSESDSAVFVPKGMKRLAEHVLEDYEQWSHRP